MSSPSHDEPLLRELRRLRPSPGISAGEPIAVVGMACRLPGAVGTPGALWELLVSGGHVIVPGTPPKITRLEGFDPDTIGLSPWRAARTAPRTRMLLELSWEALADAGVLARDDYPIGLFLGASDAGGVVAQTAGHLRLGGPAMVIDAEEASGLTAIHQACLSLRNRGCAAALAGGMQILESVPAARGACRSFDARSDGASTAEGMVLLVLKPLKGAQRDHDRVYAVIHGGALAHQGAEPAADWASLLDTALLRSGKTSADIGLLEAHGAGLPADDAAELAGIAAAVGGDRAAPVAVGAARTNLGDLGYAGGAAGMARALLALHHQTIPAHLHFARPLPAAPGEAQGVRIATDTRPWEGPPLAGVSARGRGGSAAHLVAGPAPLLPGDATLPEREIHLLPLSAPTRSALIASVELLLTTIDDGVDVADLCFSAATGRPALAERLAILFTDLDELRDGLRAAAAGRPDPLVLQGRVDALLPVLYVFSGEADDGPDGLYAAEPAFASVVDQCALAEDTWDGSPGARFVAQMALAALWRSWGLAPSAAIGSGVGLLSAACHAEVFEPVVGLALMDGLEPETTLSAPTIPLFDGDDAHACPPRDLCDPAHWDRPYTQIAMGDAGLGVLEAWEGAIICIGASPAVEAAEERLDAGLPSLVCPAPPPGPAASLLITEQLARLWIHGAEVDWDAYHSGRPARRCPLPAPSWQRRALERPPAPARGAVTVHSWRWQREPSIPVSGPVGRWVLLGLDGSIIHALEGALRQQGQDVVVFRCRPGGNLGAGVLDPRAPEQIDSVLAMASDWGEEPLAGVVVCWDGPSPDTPSGDGVLCSLHALQSLRGLMPDRCPLRLVTRGAVDVGGREPSDALRADLWGLAATIAAAFPGQWGGVIDLDPAAPYGAEAGALAELLCSPDDDDRAALRGGMRHVPRLERGSVSRAPLLPRSEGRVWLLGEAQPRLEAAARWLAQTGVSHLAMNASDELATELARWGCRLEAAPSSVADGLERFVTAQIPLLAVVHAPATLGAQALSELTAADVTQRLLPALSRFAALHRGLHERSVRLITLVDADLALGRADGALDAMAAAVARAFNALRGDAGLPGTLLALPPDLDPGPTLELRARDHVLGELDPVLLESLERLDERPFLEAVRSTAMDAGFSEPITPVEPLSELSAGLDEPELSVPVAAASVREGTVPEEPEPAEPEEPQPGEPQPEEPQPQEPEPEEPQPEVLEVGAPEADEPKPDVPEAEEPEIDTADARLSDGDMPEVSTSEAGTDEVDSPDSDRLASDALKPDGPEVDTSESEEGSESEGASSADVAAAPTGEVCAEPSAQDLPAPAGILHVEAISAEPTAPVDAELDTDTSGELTAPPATVAAQRPEIDDSIEPTELRSPDDPSAPTLEPISSEPVSADVSLPTPEPPPDEEISTPTQRAGASHGHMPPGLMAGTPRIEPPEGVLDDASTVGVPADPIDPELDEFSDLSDEQLAQLLALEVLASEEGGR